MRPLRHYLRISLLAVGVSASAWAQAPAAADGGGIAGAKKEFQALQNTEAVPTSARIELPRINVPQLSDTAPAAPTPPSREQALSAQKEKSRQSKNWLVDAMMKDSPDKRHDSELGDNEDDDATNQSADPFARLINEQHRSVRAQPSAEDEQAGVNRDKSSSDASSRMSNPLAAYMTDWISATDRALLLPESGPDNASNSRPGAAAWGQNSPGFAPAPAANGDFGADFDALEPVDNPYLPRPENVPGPAGLPASNPQPAPADLAVPAMPAPARPNVEPPAPASRSPATAPPAFAKPDDDTKYFPQLKRF